MNSVHIRSMDLNLLTIAAALFRHKNVSKAGTELGLSQSAVSHALSRLRDHFKDPMFVRTSKGVAPTEFARSIQEDLLSLLDQTALLVSRKKSFDPLEVRERITLATTDYFEAVVMPRLQPILMSEAPHLQISLRPTLGELPKREIEEGRVDLAIAGFYPDLPEGFYQAKLMTDTFACAAHKNHSIFKSFLPSIEGYLAEKHALITLQGDFRDSFDQGTGKKKQKRELVYGSYSFTGMAWVLTSSDLILTAPVTLLKAYEKYFPIRIFPCPVNLGSIDLRMVWHAQTHSNPLHTWFRSKLRVLMRS